MKKYLSIMTALFIVIASAFFVYQLKKQKETSKVVNLGGFDIKQTCAIQPQFLAKLKVPQPIAVDLSQDRYRGVAFLFGRNLSQAVHPKSWERFDHFSSYILDPEGNMYLTPMPYISVKPTTFNLQKNIYRLDSHSGRLAIWMGIDEVKADSNNPFGIISIDYDCDDHTLWVSAIDETDYTTQRGVIYHIDVKSKEILQRVEGIDALSLKLLHTEQGKYLLAGSARENILYAYEINNAKLSTTPKKVLELPDANEHIRKILVRGKNHLELQTIPFSYTLIAQTVEQGGIRTNYDAKWDELLSLWELTQKR
ncbi:MAG: hypothetical protein K0U38_01880 [Epsilonproteobacteria bacterium]|nr:hypothetical protein [Campylobacterota bacterium]